jgi:hypothetical protein
MKSQVIVVSREMRAPCGYTVVNVARPTPLGNPYKMRVETERDDVCDKYSAWFSRAIEHRPTAGLMLYGLLARVNRGEKLALSCWCAPRRCHAETIRDWLLAHREASE